MADGHHRLVHARRIHIQMRDKTQAVQAGRLNAAIGQVLEQIGRPRFGRARQVNEDDIGVRRFDLQAVNASQPVGQPLRQRMVLRQPLDMVVQRMGSRCRQHTGLAHAAAGHFADAVCARNEVTRAAQRRANRRAQPLAEAHRYAVKTLGDAPRLKERITGTLDFPSLADIIADDFYTGGKTILETVDSLGAFAGQSFLSWRNQVYRMFDETGLFEEDGEE